MKLKIIFLLLILFSKMAFARVDCPADEINNIQIERGFVLYFQSGVWRMLGSLSTPGTKERYSALLAAQMAGRKASIAYDKEVFNCSVTNYSDEAYLVRTY